jgi:hypothetical protein
VERIWIWQASGDPLSFSIAGAITDHDPSFSLDAFIPFAEAAFLRVNRARGDGQLEPVRHLLADGLWQEFQAEGPKPERAGMAVGSAEATQAGQDGSWDSVVVRFTTRAPERGGGSLVEDWIFQRPVASSADSGAAPAECPVCGAPLSLTEEGSCRYCGAAARGGLGGWRLVRTAPARASTARPGRLPRARGSRLGWAVAAVILAATLVPVIFTLVVTGVTAGVQHGTLNVVPSTRPAQVSGHASFTGALNENPPGRVTVSGGVTGACSSRARQASGLTFSDIESVEGGRKALVVHVSLPPGMEGPGEYDLATTSSQLTVSYSLSPGQAGSKPASQIWKPQPGLTVASLVIRPDASGKLTANGLAPTFPKPGSPLGQALNLTVAFSCG